MKKILTGLLIASVFASTTALSLTNDPVITLKIADYYYQYNTNVSTVFCHGEVWQTVYTYGPPTIFRSEICVG